MRNGTALNPISVVESAYSLEGNEDAWLRELASRALPGLPAERGLIACLYDATDPGWIRTRSGAALGIDLDLVRRLHAVPVVRGADSAAMVQLVRSGAVTTLRKGIGGIPACKEHYEPLFRAEGLRDILYVNAADPTHHGVLLIIPSTQGTWAPGTAYRWKRIASHIAAGMRVRRELAQFAVRDSSSTPVGLTEQSPLTEAILSPEGRVEHATEAAKDPRARAALRRAAIARDRARSSLQHREPQEALDLWQALIGGRWSLVDRFDADGRRFVVARRNDPNVGDPRGLTVRERQVLAYAALGHANKLIAYEMGLSSSTVAVHLMRARAKIAELELQQSTSSRALDFTDPG